jgi:hypothetical protein
MLHWTWRDGKPILATTQSLPASLKLTAGYLLTTPVEIKRIEPHSSYRTLGVHISPNGSPKGVTGILSKITLEYAQAITGSHLSREEAILSYVQYLFPKLRLQLPDLPFTDHECNKLMSIILKAVLPKMHVNRNTARCIIHGPVILGSMALPHIHTVQGIDKFRLFLGHLRLQDDTGMLIHIALTYVQLLSGSSKNFLNKSYSTFSWLDWGWVTSLWHFISTTFLSFFYPGMWLPTAPREGDIFLMEYFTSQRLPKAVHRVLNACRLYLRVITLSNIASVDGRYIAPEAKAGTPLYNFGLALFNGQFRADLDHPHGIYRGQNSHI